MDKDPTFAPPLSALLSSSTVQQNSLTVQPSNIAGYPNSGGLFLAGDGSWKTVGLTLITDQKLATAAATVTFLNIPQTYRHLQVEVFGRGDNASSSVDVQFQFNNDTGANYAHEYQQIVGSAATAPISSTGRTNFIVVSLPGNTATANYFSLGSVRISEYTNAKANKTAYGAGGLWTSGPIIILASGFWASTASVTSIKMTASAGNFVAGSRFTLYGLT